jgi:hypothetical protein
MVFGFRRKQTVDWSNPYTFFLSFFKQCWGLNSGVAFRYHKPSDFQTLLVTVPGTLVKSADSQLPLLEILAQWAYSGAI